MNRRKFLERTYFLLGAGGLIPNPPARSEKKSQILTELDRYNVIYDSPGQSDRDSMPMGNGEVGINLWIEENGDLQFYIARSDSLSELDRDLKLGKVRISLLPNPFRRGKDFNETLKLRDGVTEIIAGDQQQKAKILVFVDKLVPTIHVIGTFTSPTTIIAAYQTWRNAPRDSDQYHWAHTIYESPDVIRGRGNQILFYHRDCLSEIGPVARLEGLRRHLNVIPDDLSNRVFGGLMTLTGSGLEGEGRLRTAKTKIIRLRVTTDAVQEANTVHWIERLRRIDTSSADAVVARRRTQKWWNSFWQKSWIFVEGDSPAQRKVTAEVRDLLKGNLSVNRDVPSVVTQAYVLTKWMTACAEQGHYPIIFNGSLFNCMPGAGLDLSLNHLALSLTAPPKGEPTLALNPDQRPWGSMTLWQNVRLSYLSMLARGEAKSMGVLFSYYRRFWQLNRLRARIYYHADGQYNTEITTSYGLQPPGVYGCERTGIPVGRSQNPWGGSVDISPGLELIAQMLDYYDYTDDPTFLWEEILPYAHDLFRYIETRFTLREDGRIVIGPVNSIETYWNTANPMPIVAGMHAVLNRLLALPSTIVADRGFLEHIQAITPPLPTEVVNGTTVLAPAGAYSPKRHNVENPSLYAIFPFRLYGLGKPSLRMAIDSYRHALQVQKGFRPYTIGWNPGPPSYSGWQQTGIEAALLGLEDDACAVLENNAALNNPGYRFPAVWGPIYDAVPDVDHGANLMNTLQLMAFQADGDRIIVLPAWPKTWNVNFRFFAPRNTTVECIYHNGKIVKLDVAPDSRRKDVITGSPHRDT